MERLAKVIFLVTEETFGVWGKKQSLSLPLLRERKERNFTFEIFTSLMSCAKSARYFPKVP